MKYRKYRFVSIRGHTTYYGVEPKWILQISPMKNQISPKYRYIESIGTSAKVVICSKIAPNLTRYRVQIACHDL